MTEGRLVAVLSASVQAAREAKGWTQRDLSEASGVLVPHISRLESGTHLPSLKTLLRIANALDVTLASLVTEVA